VKNAAFSNEDYRALAAFRAALRRFQRFSETAAREAGLTPQQHQLLLAARGHDGPEPPTITDLAEALQIKHNSAVELIDRVAQRGLVERQTSQQDNRRVHVIVTAAGEQLLRSLTAAHRSEIRELESVLSQLTARFEADARRGSN